MDDRHTICQNRGERCTEGGMSVANCKQHCFDNDFLKHCKLYRHLNARSGQKVSYNNNNNSNNNNNNNNNDNNKNNDNSNKIYL